MEEAVRAYYYVRGGEVNRFLRHGEGEGGLMRMRKEGNEVLDAKVESRAEVQSRAPHRRPARLATLSQPRRRTDLEHRSGICTTFDNSH